MRESREILLTHQVRTSDAVRPFQRYFMIHLLHEALGRAKLNLVVSLQPIDSILISGACLEKTKTIVTVLCSVHYIVCTAAYPCPVISATVTVIGFDL